MAMCQLQNCQKRQKSGLSNTINEQIKTGLDRFFVVLKKNPLKQAKDHINRTKTDKDIAKIIKIDRKKYSIQIFL